jgi:hypothetical protein
MLDPFQYAWWTINYFLILWASSAFVRYLFQNSLPSKWRAEFAELDVEKQRNVVTYVLEIVVTTFALAAQLYGGADVLFRRDEVTSETHADWMLLSLMCIAILYVWEMVYRERFGWPLLLHHLSTLLFIQLVVATYFQMHQVLYIRCALALGLYATTEQLSFVALFCFRLKQYPGEQALLFRLAAMQSFIVKTAVTIGVVVYYYIFLTAEGEQHPQGAWGMFWKICFLPLLLLLYSTQLFASKIMYALAERCSTMAIELEDNRRVAMSQMKRRTSDALLTDYENLSSRVGFTGSVRSLVRIRPLGMDPLEETEVTPQEETEATPQEDDEEACAEPQMKRRTSDAILTNYENLSSRVGFTDSVRSLVRAGPLGMVPLEETQVDSLEETKVIPHEDDEEACTETTED